MSSYGGPKSSDFPLAFPSAPLFTTPKQEKPNLRLCLVFSCETSSRTKPHVIQTTFAPLVGGGLFNLGSRKLEREWPNSPACCRNSLPEFMSFKLFGKTILVVNIKFGFFVGHPLSK